MRKYFTFMSLWAALLTAAHAQPVLGTITPTGPVQSLANLGGILYASNFGQFRVPPGNLGTYSWNNANFCQPTASGLTFNAFTVGSPVEIIDTDTPANDESVTPSAVTIVQTGPYTSTCSITVSPAHPHTHYYYTSATAGLQEAINWARTATYEVILTPDWALLGGTTGEITAASGGTNVSILDARTSQLTPYTWSGSAYVAGTFGGGFTNPMSAVGDMIYGGTGGAATRLAGNTSSSTECLTSTGTGSAAQAPAWGSCGGSAAFSGLTSGTNTSAAMVVGSGASLTATGSGSIVATESNNWSITTTTANQTYFFPLLGSGVAGFQAGWVDGNNEIFYNPSTERFTVPNATLSGISGSTQCLHVDSSGNITGTGSDCGSGGGGANTALSNLASVSINTALLAQTSIDLGSTAKPFRNLYFYGSGTYGTDYIELTGSPTSTRTWTFPDGTDTVTGLGLSQTLTNKTLTSPILGGTPTAANATQFILPYGSGATAAANGELKYDTTNLNWHVWQNGVDNFAAVFPVASPPTSGDCVEFLKSTNSWSLEDAGAACGSGSGPTLQTNASNNSSQTTLNIENSTSNSAGFSVTMSNPSGGNVKAEVGISSQSTALSALGAAAALANQIDESSPFSPTCTNSYYVSASVTATLPNSCGTGGIMSFQVKSGFTLTLTAGSLTYNGPATVTGPASFSILYDGTNLNAAWGNAATVPASGVATGTLQAGVNHTTLTTSTNCAAAGTAANPSVASCSAAPVGRFSCATNASTGTCVVDTSAVTANSIIQIQPDSTLGTALSVTCNTTADSGLTAPRVSARSAGTSFTITLGTFTTNPECFSYIIIN